jgi:hypothetical protein
VVQLQLGIHDDLGRTFMIFKLFSYKKAFAKKLAFFVRITASFCKNLIIILVFEKNANFLLKIGKNCRKLANFAENYDNYSDTSDASIVKIYNATSIGFFRNVYIVVQLS